MREEQIRQIIEARIALYRHKQSQRSPFAANDRNEWDTIDHTIEALEYLQSEFDAALAAPPQT